MKSIFNTLKYGVTKNEYPVYGQYVNSTGEQLQTYNSDVLVCIDYKLPFVGSTNFFVLEEALSKIQDYSITQQDEIINIKAYNFESKLLIDDVNFPDIQPYNYKHGIEIDDELLYALSFATKFVGDKVLEFIVITPQGILSTDYHKIFFYEKRIYIQRNKI